MEALRTNPPAAKTAQTLDIMRIPLLCQIPPHWGKRSESKIPYDPCN
jgi:hypothetical protein